jgi:hypothetical protein
MPQTITFDQRQSGPRRDLDTDSDTAEFLVPAQGDFARGQRHETAAARSYGDFATGMRNTSMPRITGDFATGMRTSPRTTTVGDFATGMRTNSTSVVIDAFSSPVSALPIAA